MLKKREEYFNAKCNYNKIKKTNKNKYNFHENLKL